MVTICTEIASSDTKVAFFPFYSSFFYTGSLFNYNFWVTNNSRIGNKHRNIGIFIFSGLQNIPINLYRFYCTIVGSYFFLVTSTIYFWLRLNKLLRITDITLDTASPTDVLTFGVIGVFAELGKEEVCLLGLLLPFCCTWEEEEDWFLCS